LWDSQRQIFLTRGLATFTGLIHMMALVETMVRGAQGYNTMFGIDEDTEPWVAVEHINRDADKAYPDWYVRAERIAAWPRASRTQMITFNNVHGDKIDVTVSLERALMEGEPVHRIRIDYTT
jgi:hypothetical protein